MLWRFTEKSEFNGGFAKNHYIGEDYLKGGGKNLCRFKWELGKKRGWYPFKHFST